MEEVCECFKHMIKSGYVNFYSLPNDILVMPYIPNTNFRYNNCPCCLSEVRELETSKNELTNMGIYSKN